MLPGSWPWGYIPIRVKELKELEEKAEKLEAVKKIVDLTYNLDTPVDGYIPNKAMYKIKKILEAEE